MLVFFLLLFFFKIPFLSFKINNFLSDWFCLKLNTTLFVDMLVVMLPGM